MKEKTEEAACLENAIKFNINSLCPKFLKCVPVTSCNVEESFYIFKNVQSDKCMSLNEEKLEKVVVHCFIKIKMYHNVELNFNTAYLYYFSASLCMFSHMIVHECVHILRLDSA